MGNPLTNKKVLQIESFLEALLSMAKTDPHFRPRFERLAKRMGVPEIEVRSAAVRYARELVEGCRTNAESPGPGCCSTCINGPTRHSRALPPSPSPLGRSRSIPPWKDAQAGAANTPT